MFLRLLGDTPSHEATHRQEEPAEVEQVREKLKTKHKSINAKQEFISQ